MELIEGIEEVLGGKRPAVAGTEAAESFAARMDPETSSPNGGNYS